MHRFPVLAAVTLAALTAVGCAAPDGSDDVDSTAGAAVGSMPERTTLYAPGGFVAYFDGGWAKPQVTLYRGDAKQTLRCEADAVSVDDTGATPSMRSHLGSYGFTCYDAPRDADDVCHVSFNRSVALDGANASSTDTFRAGCSSAGRITPKQRSFLKFVLGENAETVTQPNPDRTEPTAERTFSAESNIKLSLKNSSADVEADPYAFSWSVMNAARDVLSRGSLDAVKVTAPGPKASASGRDFKRRPFPAKEVALAENGKAVAYPVMIQRLAAVFGVK